jgi:hypothetical protein
MRYIVIILSFIIGGAAFAQSGAPSGRGAVQGDPASSSANPNSDTTPGKSRYNPSGSGTSTSGGKDANRDQGRDSAPYSNKTVKPLDQQRPEPK